MRRFGKMTTQGNALFGNPMTQGSATSSKPAVRRRAGARILAALLSLVLLTGCGNPSLNAVADKAVDAVLPVGQESTNALSDGEAVGVISLMTQNSVETPVNYEQDDLDAQWQLSEATQIQFSDQGIAVSGAGAAAVGAVVTIGMPGTYVLSGSSEQGQVIVYSEIKGTVRLVLNGLSLANRQTAPIVVEKAGKVVLILADGTENIIRDGDGSVNVAQALTNESDNSVEGSIAQTADTVEIADPNAAIWCKGDLTITGTGSLYVSASRNHGILSKDTLRIMSGTMTVVAVADGIKARDAVAIAGGTIAIEAGSDGVQASNDEDAQKGFVSVEGGSTTIHAHKDGIEAETDVLLLGGTLTVTTGTGSGSLSAAQPQRFGRDTMQATSSADDESRKGIKAGNGILVGEIALDIDAQDDALHANNRIEIRGGTCSLASADDGIHADTAILIESGSIDITKSYEGIESLAITVLGGHIQMVTADDGFNVAGGADGSSVNGRAGQNAFAAIDGALLSIQGGTIRINANGDGLDSNGAIEMTGGDVLVFGPTNSANGAIDYNGSFAISGGTLLAIGSSGMAQAPDTNSSQPVLMVNLTSLQPAGTLLSIVDEAGTLLTATVPDKAYQSVVYSAPQLQIGDTVTINFGGTASGETIEGLYPAGTEVSNALMAETVLLTEAVTSQGVTGFGSGMRGGGGFGKAVPDGEDGQMPELSEHARGQRPFGKDSDGQMPVPPEGVDGQMPVPPEGVDGQMPVPPEDVDGN